MSPGVRRLLLIAAPLTLLVIVAGAFTRLSDAGLGCPDWPACYGQLIGVPNADVAAAHSPDSPLEPRKAWIEVGHRYVAAVLGLLLFAAAALSLRIKPIPRPPLLLAILVIFQALLGMLTVTEQLRPLVVSAHLLGGILLFAILGYALTKPAPRPAHPEFLRATAMIAAAILTVQIFLGGWVSTNYAALACPDFPTCHNGWLPPTLDWSGFAPGRELHLDAAGNPVSAAALATIHWTHRFFALVATLVLGGFGVLLWRGKMFGAALGLWALLILQIILGIWNVLQGLPLWSAVLHNAVAALLAVKIAKIMAILSHPAPAVR